MDTKLKNDELEWTPEAEEDHTQSAVRKTKGILAWLAFFIGVNLLVASLLMGFCGLISVGQMDQLPAVLKGEAIKEQPYFKQQMANYFSTVVGALVGDESKAETIFNGEEAYTRIYLDNNGRTIKLIQGYTVSADVNDTTTSEITVVQNGATNDFVTSTAEEPKDLRTTEQQRADMLQSLNSWLGEEGENLRYFAVGPQGEVLSNTEMPLLDAKGQVILPEGYDYYMYFDGQKLTAYEQSKGAIDLQRLDSGYQFYSQDYWQGSNYFKQYPELAQCKIVMVVKQDLVKNPYGYSELYGAQGEARLVQGLFLANVIGAGLGLVIIIGAFFKRRQKRLFDRSLAALSSRIWLEVKLIAGFFLALGFFSAIFVVLDSAAFGYYGQIIGCLFWVLLMLICGWGLYILLLDLVTNKKQFFTHNMASSFMKLLRSKEMLQPFQKRMLSRFYLLIGIEIFLVLIAVFCIFTVIIPMFAVGLGVFFLLNYMKYYKQTVEDIGKICDQIERIKAGDMETELILSEDAALYSAAQNLNSIQEGVVVAAEQRMKSERLKIDLVTNVSHDLKTPLTSIISYVDLLAREEDLPPEAQDYVRILRQKSDRLKALINDLFDLSKATSANLDVSLERIDFAKLLHQVAADLEESIEHSGLGFKVNIDQGPVMIMSDGGKMHRVLENLLINAIKYSLEGSRVYIDLSVNGSKATATIKNTAKYEMDFDAETVLGRFVRGDQARATEGSGLGLAIAQSYTEACGGKFELTIDGDLFKAGITFELIDFGVIQLTKV